MINNHQIPSPNYANAMHAGDGSAFNVSGSPVSAEIQTFFEDYFIGMD
jgi:hypothetical protein